jgi:hypothetical protein
MAEIRRADMVEAYSIEKEMMSKTARSMSRLAEDRFGENCPAQRMIL